MAANYVCYFKDAFSGNFRTLQKNGVFATLPFSEFFKFSHRYECQKFENTDEGLLLFHQNFIQATSELLQNGINYFDYYTHNLAVENVFKRNNGNHKIWSEQERILPIESEYMEDCNNAGIMGLYDAPGIYSSFGYDFTSQYPTIMASPNFIMPTKQGKETFLEILPEKIELGYYYVKISSNHPDIRKVFAFSPKNCYASYSVEFALQHQRQFNIKFEMDATREKNAYIYATGDGYTVRGSYLFRHWFALLSNIKKKHPKNKLAKHLLSSCWAQLGCFNKIYVPAKLIDEEYMKTCTHKINLLYSGEMENDYHILGEFGKPYKNNIRIKAFLTAFARNKTAEVAMRNLPEVLRIHTDGIVFKSPQNFIPPIAGLLLEAKSTGLIHWQSCKTKINIV